MVGPLQPNLAAGLKGKRRPEDCGRLTAVRPGPRSRLSPRAAGRATGDTGGGSREGKDDNPSVVVTPGTLRSPPPAPPAPSAPCCFHLGLSQGCKRPAAAARARCPRAVCAGAIARPCAAGCSFQYTFPCGHAKSRIFCCPSHAT